MKFQREKWFRDRLYEVYFELDWKSFFFGFTIADVDFEIHYLNLRDRNGEVFE
jgi:hypothetical protein